MEKDKQDQIRRRAYEIWESEERPQGEDLRHWLRASEELGGENENNQQSTMRDNGAVLPEGPDEDPALQATNLGEIPDPDGPGRSPGVGITTGETAASVKIKETEGP